MKKLFLVGALALFGAMNAQETRFGAKAGYVMSNLKAEGEGETYEFDAKSSFYIGGLVEHKFNDTFGLQGELLFSPIGGKQSESFTYVEPGLGGTISVSEETDWKFGTLQIPVMGKFYATESLAFAAGMNFGIIISAEVDYEATASYEGFSETESGSEDIKDDVNTLNLAPFIGAEYNLENGLFFDARYNLGVSNLIKNPEGDENLKNSFLQVGLGYKF